MSFWEHVARNLTQSLEALAQVLLLLPGQTTTSQKAFPWTVQYMRHCFGIKHILGITNKLQTIFIRRQGSP